MDLRYSPEFRRLAREVHGGYAVDSDPASGVGPPEGVNQDVLDIADIFDSIDHVIEEVDTLLREQGTDPMMLPVDPEEYPEVSRAVQFTSNGDHDNFIDGTDWSRAYSIATDDSILARASEFDPMEMLWAELKIRISDWLASILDKIPLVGDDLADALRTDSDASKERSMQAALGLDSMDRPLTLDQLVGVSGMGHADTILKHVRGETAKPQELTFNPIAVDVKPVADNMASNWRATKRVIASGYGIRLRSTEPVNKTNILKWLQDGGTNAYSVIGKSIMSDDLWKYGVSRTDGYFRDLRGTLHGYLTGQDLACCLLDNILGLGEVSGDTLKFLKMLRLGLLYSFNGITVGVDSLFNILADVLRIIIDASMAKVIDTISSAMTDKLMEVRNYFDDYSRSKGDAWVRCYPFDELMAFTMRALHKMEGDLLSYIRDYTGKLKLGHVNATKYTLELSRREYARRMIRLVDTLVRGIETGIICKDMRNISVEYTRPTPAELRRFTEDSIYRSTVNVHEAARRYNMGPDSAGKLDPTIDLVGKDLQWLQNCNLSMTESELDRIREGIGGIL